MIKYITKINMFDHHSIHIIDMGSDLFLKSSENKSLVRYNHLIFICVYNYCRGVLLSLRRRIPLLGRFSHSQHYIVVVVT